MRALFILLFLIGMGAKADISREDMVLKYDLSVNEADRDAQALYEEGMRLYNYPGESQGAYAKTPTYPKRPRAMDYLIPAALKGSIEAAMVVMEYFHINAVSNRHKRDMLDVAYMLHEKGHILGSYMLANAYNGGRGVKRDDEKAQVLYEKVDRLCVSNRSEAIKLLNPLNTKGLGERRCVMAKMQTKIIKDTKGGR